MPCDYPVGTYRLDGTQTYRPCGSCVGCRLGYAQDWSSRCIHEASFYDQNSYITLTFNNENLPKDGSIRKEHVKDFIRRLRKYVEPKKIRYFASGEYGSKLGRPHYHALVFGHDFNDKEIVKGARYHVWKNRFKRTYDHDLYFSRELEKIWPYGYNTVGEVTKESAGYVARYVAKKINGDRKKEHYGKKEPEFALMSRMPGIGRRWIEKFITDVYPKDYYTINGNKYRPGRYYDSVCEKLYPKLWDKVKEKRRKAADEKPYESSIRQMQRERHKIKTTGSLKRRLER